MLLLIGILLSSCNEENGNEATAPERENEVEEGAGELDEEQVLNIVEGSEIPAMDSVMAEDVTSFNILTNVNEGLYRLDQENIAEPAMAEGEPEVSEDGLTYIFT